MVILSIINLNSVYLQFEMRKNILKI